MKPSDIKVGKTYCNRGAGRTRRKVLEISDKLKIKWFGSGDPPNEPVVRYSQSRNGELREDVLFISSFASWAGSEAKDE